MRSNPESITVWLIFKLLDVTLQILTHDFDPVADITSQLFWQLAQLSTGLFADHNFVFHQRISRVGTSFFLRSLCFFAAMSLFVSIARLRIRGRKICDHFLAHDPDIQDIRCDRWDFFAGEKRIVRNDS